MSATDGQPLSSNINGNYNFKIVSEDQKEIGNSLVESRQDRQGRFWHLENLYISPEYRSKGYGTTLLNYIREYVWNVDRLRIRVHPAIGQQASENWAENLQKINSKDNQELGEYLDSLSDEEWLEWVQNNSSKIGWMEFNSDNLIRWYQNRGFTIKDPDEKHLWCDPEFYNPADLETRGRITADLGSRGRIIVLKD